MKKSFRVAILLGIMRTIRPLLGPIDMCIYPYYTCTDHAIDQLEHRSLIPAVLAIFWRFLFCNPISAIIYRLRGNTTGRITSAKRPTHDQR